MACRPNEMTILKGTSGKLDADTIIILSLMYHTEIDPSDPAGQKKDRSKSSYRYEGRIMKIADLNNEIASMEAKPTEKWKWPGVEPWDIGYDGYMTNERGAKWLKSRLSKAMQFQSFYKLVSEGLKPSGKVSKSARYELTGYKMNGKEFSIVDDPAVLLNNLGSFSKVIK